MTTIAHTATAIVLNDGKTAYVYDRGYFAHEDFITNPPKHVELEKASRAIAKSCEVYNDGEYVYVFGKGKYFPYSSVIDGRVSFEAPKTFDAEAWITEFIQHHTALGECTIEEWEHFSDIYKDEYNVRPRFGSFKFHIV